MDNTIITNEQEVKDVQTGEVNPADTDVSTTKVEEEKPVSELLESDKSDTERKDDNVPLAKFLDIKKQNKELEKRLKELEANIQEGSPKREVSRDIKEIAEKHGVDADFLEELASTVRKQAEADIEERIKPITQKEKAEKFDKAFGEQYQRAMAKFPELDGVVNQSVIKTLALDPANAKKTITQLIEESYGNASKGKATLDPSSSVSRTDTQGLDYSKAQNDAEYFKQVMSNPKLKEEYNKKMLTDLMSRM